MYTLIFGIFGRKISEDRTWQMCTILKEVIQSLGLNDANMRLLSSVQLQNIGVHGSITQCSYV